MDIQIGLTGLLLFLAAMTCGPAAWEIGSRRVERACAHALCIGVAMMFVAALVAIWTRLP